MEGNDLLEELARRAGCLYLSDLHTPRNKQAIRQAVKTVERDAYSAEQWREAYQYITGSAISCVSEKEIRLLFER